jgi:putative Mg2+ transporter-C (MgtC) family protein
MDFDPVFVLRLLVAAVLGGLIGLERELAGKPAGLRTNVLICIGSALLTQLSHVMPVMFGGGDPARIAAQVVAGVGFLGAGTILRQRQAVHGLTSAATIWVVMAVGVTVGAGLLRGAVIATVLILGTLVLLRRMEHWLAGQEVVTVSLSLAGKVPEPAVVLKHAGLKRRLLHSRWTASGGDHGRLTLTWRGKPRDIDTLGAVMGEIPDTTLESWEVEE